MGIGDVQELLLDKIPATKTKTKTLTGFIETDWTTQRKAIVTQLGSAGRGFTPNYGWMFHEILVSIDSAKQLLADEEIVRLLSIHLATASDSHKFHYNNETRPLAIFLVGFFNYTLNSPESDKVLQVLSGQKQGFLSFLVKHVEPQVLAEEIPKGVEYKPVYRETPAFNFFQFFVELTKPQQLHLALAQALCDGCQSYVAAYMSDPQQAYVASLFTLLLPYVETISDELTTVGEKAAAHFDSLTPFIVKLLNNTSYYELPLNLLTVILRKYTPKKKVLEWLPSISNTLVAYITAVFTGKSVIYPPTVAYYSPSFPQQRLVLIAELLIPLLQYQSMRDLMKKYEMVDIILDLTLQQEKQLFFSIGVAFIRALVAANCAAALISDSFVKQVIVRMRSPCIQHAHFKEIVCILFKVREFAKLFNTADAAFVTAAPKSIDATNLVNLSKQLAKASNEIQQLELENEIADMDADIKCIELENEVSQLKLRSRAIRAIWHSKKNSLLERIEKETLEKTTRENNLREVLIQISAEVDRNEEQKKVRERELERAKEREAELEKAREQERQDQERLEQEREKVRLDQELQEQARQEHTRLERERREIERRERERQEGERKEQERHERERQERELQQREQQVQERLERDHQERERQEREQQERLERDHQEREQQERERQEQEQERERQEQEQLERDRQDRERQERERLERKRQEQERLERDRQEREQQERLERDRQERERQEREQQERLERDRQEREQQEREQLEQERQEQERLEQQESERLERERQERERERERQAQERQALAQYQYACEQYATERMRIEFRGTDNQMLITIEQEIKLSWEDSPMDEGYNQIATEGEEEIMRQQREADQARDRMHIDG